VPVWGGLVLKRTRGSGDLVEMSLGTLEVWLDGVFIRDTLTYAGTGQNALVADLCTRYVIDGALPGLPLRVSGGTGGTARDRKYTDAMDKSVLSALTELSGVEGGLEWTIGWEHQSSPERYTPVLYVGDRIGASPIAGLSPAATFEMPGAVTVAELTEDWSAGKGATDVIATSSAVADVRPQSPHQTSADPDRPRVEHRFTPSTSISVVSTLTAHAARVLADMADGARTLSLTAVLSDAPRLGRVWALGDDVGYSLGGTEPDPTRVWASDVYLDLYADLYGSPPVLVLAHPEGRDSVPAFPGGLSGSARAIGWEITLPAAGVVGTITPTLVLPGESA